MLHECLTPDGFLATPTDQDNYRRVWGRDSVITGMAALMTEDEALVDGCRASLETLAANQGPHGEIPSNVDPPSGLISYGGTAGRVDADLWFVIGCGAYWRHTSDNAFLQRMKEPLDRVRFLLGAWEFNNRGLLYVPPTGDWADEYLQSGYVLFDQLLYLQAQCALRNIDEHFGDRDPEKMDQRVDHLRNLIRANYWFPDHDTTPQNVYHEVLFEKGRKAGPRRGGSYWMPFFSPLGYGYRFDALANILVTLFGVADEELSEVVDDHIANSIVQDDVMVLPAFYPVITPRDEEWDDLQITFSHTFKNAPWEYHNGGLWPMVTGFYAVSLAARGKMDLANRYRDGIHRANASPMEDQSWSFPEYLHGKRHTAGGKSPMAWSAAAAIMAEQACAGNPFPTAP
jgi:glycogen debranching enzyme